MFKRFRMRAAMVATCSMTCGGLEASAVTISASYLERQEKVQDYELGLANARTRLANTTIKFDQQRMLCDDIRARAARGHVGFNVLQAFEAELLNLETQVDQANKLVTDASLNHEIWSIRLAGERGQTVDTVRLAELYVAKWESALEVSRTEMLNARSVERRAEEYFAWSERQLSRGYISQEDHRKAGNELAMARNEAALQVIRQDRVEDFLEHARENLAEVRRGG